MLNEVKLPDDILLHVVDPNFVDNQQLNDLNDAYQINQNIDVFM